MLSTSSTTVPLLASWILLSILTFTSQTFAAPLFPNQFGPALGLGSGDFFRRPTSTKVTTTAVKTTSTIATPTKSSSSSSSAKSTITSSSSSLKSSSSSTISSSSTSASASATVAANKIRGVNLGGWFVLEQWMTPDLFQSAQNIANQNSNNITAVDQSTFMTAINNTQNATSLLQNHWNSWIVESDFQQIASIGLNTVRIPVGHWTFNSSTSEPYLGGGAELPYLDQAISWASKYNLNVMLDMHTAPNSQNGFENSGLEGQIGFQSVNGSTNAARLNSALIAMVQRYVNDPQYNGIVKYVEVLNEPLCSVLGADYMTYIYRNAAQAINSAISSSAKSTPQIILHDCFISPLSNWSPAVSSGGGLSDVQFILDTHMYQTSNSQTFQQNINLANSNGQQIYNATQTLNRQIVTGEFSLGIACSDCNFNSSEAVATANRQFFETQTKAYEQGAGWIFWSWKSENNLPWSYKDALTVNWIPSNPTNQTEALPSSSSASTSSTSQGSGSSGY